MFQKIRAYNRKFWADESGAEMMEIAIGIACAAAIVGIVIAIVVKVQNYISSAGDTLDENLQDLDDLS